MREGEYAAELRQTIAEAPGLRVRVLELCAGQSVPWHKHSAITDTFFCLAGPLEVHLREPGVRIRLEVGESLAVDAGRPHHVRGVAGGRCRFLVVQGVGEYDYLPVP